MICPKCMGETKVVGTTKGIQNERFRKCKNCGFTFQTVEAIRFDDYWREYARETLNSDHKIEFEQKKDD